MARDLVDSSLLQGWQELLKQFGSDRAQAADPNQPSELPESLEGTSPGDRDVKSHGTGVPRGEAAEDLDVVRRSEVSVPLSDIRSERGRLQKLLGQVGLESLCLPSNGVLSLQWRAFLDQLGSTSQTGRAQSRRTVAP